APASAKTSRCVASRYALQLLAGSLEAAAERSSSFTSQRVNRIEFHRAPYGRSTSGKGNDNCDRKNHREQDRLNRDLRTENRSPDSLRKNRAAGEARSSAQQGEQGGFGKEKSRDGKAPRAQRLHEPNFSSALEDCRGHRRRNR